MALPASSEVPQMPFGQGGPDALANFVTQLSQAAGKATDLAALFPKLVETSLP